MYRPIIKSGSEIPLPDNHYTTRKHIIVALGEIYAGGTDRHRIQKMMSGHQAQLT